MLSMHRSFCQSHAIHQVKISDLPPVTGIDLSTWMHFEKAGRVGAFRCFLKPYINLLNTWTLILKIPALTVQHGICQSHKKKQNGQLQRISMWRPGESRLVGWSGHFLASKVVWCACWLDVALHLSTTPTDNWCRKSFPVCANSGNFLLAGQTKNIKSSNSHFCHSAIMCNLTLRIHALLHYWLWHIPAISSLCQLLHCISMPIETVTRTANPSEDGPFPPPIGPPRRDIVVHRKILQPPNMFQWHVHDTCLWHLSCLVLDGHWEEFYVLKHWEAE